MRAFTLLLAGVAAAHLSPSHSALRQLTVDDLMRLRTILEVKIAPDGRRVAYVVSQPVVERNAHQAQIFVVATGGGSPSPVASDAHVFTPALPVARLRWTPDGTRLSFLGL